MNLITGRAGAAHITPRQDAMWHQGLIEMESCIFDAYENFAAEIITNNEVRIRSGVGMLQGRFFCIEPNTYDSAEITNGNQGEERIDLIVARIAVDASTNTQSASIEVIQGTPAAENPTSPEAVTGDLDAGDLIADYPIVEVLLNGINIESLTPVFNTGWLFNGAGRQKLSFIGSNPISSVAEDTTANWAALRTGIAGYNTLGMITDQPTTYGVLINNVYYNTVTQIWQGTNANGMWYRRGNQTGWQSTWIRVLDENNGAQIKKLWQNASPASAFAAQTISLNLSEYDFVLVVYNYAKGTAQQDSQIIEMGKTGLLNMSAGSNGTVLSRKAEPSTTGVFFEGANRYTTSNSATNDYAIPISIYGIKGVQ